MQLGCEARGELIDELAACEGRSCALGDERVDDGVGPVGLVDEEPLGELVAGHGLQPPPECVDFASQATVVADDRVGAVRESGGGDVVVLAVDGRHCDGGDVAFVVRGKGARAATWATRPCRATGSRWVKPAIRLRSPSSRIVTVTTERDRSSSNADSNKSHDRIGTSTSASSTATNVDIRLQS
jgi:hypothetical protein